jgi:hypothetical protein
LSLLVNQGFSPVNNCPVGSFGINCNSSESVCAMSQPCLNSGICIENSTNQQGYTCECQWGFNGSNCQDDQRPCKSYTCFQRGKYWFDWSFR